ncbi:hypothetical protein HDC94_001064 [Leifsonia sp. AK011]|uniref:hypothetical protein n=1 Tax=Leifsonia sp. AK011 TaxID=2723075 RepID=UPI0015C69992|nr:hypothetical protein [Leifsonia sp. AK011]NYF09908.1 hypothetical protein [Leifsonia sp. AK011]
MANDIPNPRPAERILAYMVVAAVGLSVLSFLALIIATAVGTTGEQFSAFPWPTIIVLPLVGLPIGLVLMIVLLVLTAVRRGREAKDASK